MSDADKPTRTEREYVLAQREAFAAGSNWQHADTRSCESIENHQWRAVRVAAAAKSLYRMKITRPRIVTDANDTSFRIVDGYLRQRMAGDNQERVVMLVALTHVPMIADLLANPTEEVEE